MKTPIANRLWNTPSSVKLMLIAAAIMLLFMLGGRDLWTQEWRWANISWYMIYSGDYLHPYLAEHAYYDKPLLSYWLMVAVSKIIGGLSTWALRLPPALAGISAIYCTYWLGNHLANKKTGLIAAWMLITTFYFIFWGRVANSDMLNLAGTLLAIVWYFAKREQPGLVNYTVFFLIIAVTSLCKGLLGAVVPLIAIVPDLIKNNRWKLHLRFSLLPALIPAALVYVLPFWASSHFGGQHYAESGLYEVYRENVMRYFDPFDHKGPIYTYFVYLPIYMLPWAIFFIPALVSLRKRWREMSGHSKWMVWSTLLIFIFFTLSGSRRNYYTLPLVPFATLMTADWIASGAEALAKRYRYAGVMAVIAFVLLFLNFGVAQPLYYYGGSRAFGAELQAQASKIRPWSDWQIVFLDARSKLTFYLNPAKPVQILGLPDQGANHLKIRANYTEKDFVKNWPMILQHKPDVIFVTRKMYLEKLKPYFKNYKIIIAPRSLGDRLLNINDQDATVAFVPL